MDFLPIKSFSLDKKSHGRLRASLQGFSGRSGAGACWTRGVTAKTPIEVIVALDNGSEHLFDEHLFDFLELCNFHVLPLSPVDVYIITRQGLCCPCTNSRVRQVIGATFHNKNIKKQLAEANFLNRTYVWYHGQGQWLYTCFDLPRTRGNQSARLSPRPRILFARLGHRLINIIHVCGDSAIGSQLQHNRVRDIVSPF